uniref:NADH dehydrogenase subunit 6 n=1 Tax=Cichlidogyrus halli TaxID=321991 RepID=UPI00315C86BF
IGLIVWLYLASIISLLISSNVLFYCIMLVLNSLCGMLLMYWLVGFAWYSLLMYLVYIGGVYILLLFVSIHNPNSTHSLGISGLNYVLSLYLLSELVGALGTEGWLVSDFSFNFCSGFEGPLYLFLCFFLVLGFFLVSVISSSKESFIR